MRVLFPSLSSKADHSFRNRHSPLLFEETRLYDQELQKNGPDHCSSGDRSCMYDVPTWILSVLGMGTQRGWRNRGSASGKYRLHQLFDRDNPGSGLDLSRIPEKLEGPEDRFLCCDRPMCRLFHSIYFPGAIYPVQMISARRLNRKTNKKQRPERCCKTLRFCNRTKKDFT